MKMGMHGGGFGGGFGPHGGVFMERGRQFTKEQEEEKTERKVSDTVLIKRLLLYARAYRRRILALTAVLVATSLMTLVNPLMTKWVLDVYIVPEMTTGDVSMINIWLIAMIILTVAQFGVYYGREYLISWVGNSIVYQIREDMVSQLESMSVRYFAEGEVGRFMSRVTNDVAEISRFISMGVVSIVTELIAITASLFIMITFSVPLTLVTFASMPIMFVLPYVLRRYMRRAFRQTRVKLAGMTSVLEESVSGMRVVQAFTQENRDMETFNTASLETTKARLWSTLISGTVQIGVGLANVTGTVILIWYGALQIASGNITLGTFVAFQSLAINFWMPMQQIMNFYNEYQNAMASSERIFELLDTEPEVKEAPEAERVDLEKAQGEIVYNNMTFGYDQANPVLKDINLTIRPNEKVALVGPTGAGKTTMINLLCRFYDPQKGAITLDGYDLKKISLQSLRKQMGIVLQDAFLFQGTVKENLKYGRPDATDEEVIAAAKAVNAHEFILRLPGGYETVIREGSSNISIGQRQLITFARALLMDPRILILDEATSSVDPYTELIIQEGLEKLLEHRTAIIIAHRLSTVRHADKIVVMNHGQIIEMGSHEELLEKGGLYNTLYMRQFREDSIDEAIERLKPPSKN
jgi:ATP-binding cassette subfamily B protein